MPDAYVTLGATLPTQTPPLRNRLVSGTRIVPISGRTQAAVDAATLDALRWLTSVEREFTA